MTRARRTPLDPDLYAAVVDEAKARFAVWPSAYASGWVVKTYKARGGRYAGATKGERTGLTKWFGESWVDLSRPTADGGYEPCGRKRTDAPFDAAHYPKCRPLREALRMTPDEVADAVRRKRRAEAQAHVEASAPARGSRARAPTRVATYRKNPPDVDPLAAWCASNESYDMLNQTEAAEGTWQAGGCVLLAKALKALYPTGRLVGIDAGGVQHVGLLVGDTVYDGNGAHAKQAWVRDWIEYEGLDPRRTLAHLVTIARQPLPGPASRADVRLVAEALAKQVRANPAARASLDDLPVVDVEEWDDGTVVEWIAVPFPYERKPLRHRDDPSSFGAVALADLIATQRRVTVEGVRRAGVAPGPRATPITVLETHDGRRYIADGHHRAVAAWLRGDDAIEAEVVQVRE